MKVNAERIDNHRLCLEVEVEEQEVNKALDKAYRKLVNKVSIPGFRKGRAPRRVLEARLGKQALLDEAFDIIAPPAYLQALREHNVEPVDQPEIEVKNFAENQPLVFRATVVIKPPVTLGEYKGLKIAKHSADVSEEDVDRQLEALRQRQARMVVVEDAVLQKGDFAIIDFTGTVDGQPFKGGDAQGYPLEVGAGRFIPGFEEQLIGARTNEQRTVTVTFPTDYFVSELAGKEAVFTVTIKDIKRKEVPPLDDEFAKDVSNFSTLAELRADLRQKMEQAAQEKATEDFKNDAVKKAVDNANVDIPDVMIEQRIDRMLEDLAINLENRGMKLADYLKYTKTDIPTLRQKYRDVAAYNVKTDLTLETIAKAEAITVSDEDVQTEIAAMARSFQATPEEVKRIIEEQGRMGALKATVLRRKAADLIVATAQPE